MYGHCKHCGAKVKLTKLLRHENNKCPQKSKVVANPKQKFRRILKATSEQTKKAFLENGFIKRIIEGRKEKEAEAGSQTFIFAPRSTIAKNSKRRCTKCGENFKMYGTNVCRQCGDR